MDSILTRGNITYFPVVPGRLEFSWRLRRFLLEKRPTVIAVELPSSLGGAYRKALVGVMVERALRAAVA